MSATCSKLGALIPRQQRSPSRRNRRTGIRLKRKFRRGSHAAWRQRLSASSDAISRRRARTAAVATYAAFASASRKQRVMQRSVHFIHLKCHGLARENGADGIKYWLDWAEAFASRQRA